MKIVCAVVNREDTEGIEIPFLRSKSGLVFQKHSLVNLD